MNFKTYPPLSAPDERPAWEKLAYSTGQADPFCSAPTWQMAFHDAFGPQRRLLIHSASDSFIAFAEHVNHPSEIFLTPIEMHWCFGCPLLGENAVALLQEALPAIEELAAPSTVNMLISGIQPGSPLSQQLTRRFAEDFDIYLHSSSVQAASSLEGGVDGYLSRRSANHRKKLRRQARRAADIGVGFERVSPTTTEECDAVYARMLAVERTSWKGIGKCGMAEPGAKEFYDFMLKRLSTTSSARVVFARHEGMDIGFIFGGMVGKVYRGQQFSYDDGWKKRSIGNIMQLEKIKWLCEEGAARYDMGPVSGPKMGYKSHWIEKRSIIQSWVFAKR